MLFATLDSKIDKAIILNEPPDMVGERCPGSMDEKKLSEMSEAERAVFRTAFCLYIQSNRLDRYAPTDPHFTDGDRRDGTLAFEHAYNTVLWHRALMERVGPAT